MAEEELQARLRELDHELEEGDITKKGFAPRRCPLSPHKTDTRRQLREAPDAVALAILPISRAARLDLGRPLADRLTGKHVGQPVRRRLVQQRSDGP